MTSEKKRATKVARKTGTNTAVSAAKSAAKKKGATKSGSGSGAYKGFTAEERAAMKEYAKELKAAARQGADKAAGEKDLLAKVAAMPEPDRSLGRKLHDIITATAPDLSPRTWYGMPAYAKDGKVLCFFQNASKFKTRYATLGFSDVANLDDGNMWPVSFAVKTLTATEEAKIRALVKKAER